ncbi:DUF2249 domain-containing protein [Salinarimonas ramus]|uniref:DUF2249 domain-containing protein n=1 Tax=Salinarimonas ramus TaxID=690164 RepID=A0A917QHW6_9HYPH|nr:DUF2249 domain-containing protein [Salinarimonas ramus]GGK51546.1 hypothetical protein GCM10011322_43200 [Salinarimonas ramus]
MSTIPSSGRVLDVRSIPRVDRHPNIMAVFDDLAPGEAFVLVNDHDPLGLYSSMQNRIAGSFTWEYVLRGPDEWRVEIGRRASSSCCGSCG